MGRERTIPLLIVGALVGVMALTFPSPPSDEDEGWGRAAQAESCPKGMASILDNFCIDRFEASTVEIDRPRKPGSKATPKILKKHSPYKPVTGVTVMAVSEKGRVPQGHISRDQAEQACFNAGKRLCTDDEWLEACRGKKPTQYPYGDQHEEGRCNDKGVSGFNLLFGPGNNTPPDSSAYTVEHMNDPRLNQLEGTVAKSGAFAKCKNGFKVHDMVGNLHEWTSNRQGTFRGGYYLDTQINGEGCDYRTTAHNGKYADYSTGFRCCFGGAEQKRVDKERKAEAAASKEAAEKAGAKASGESKKAKSKKTPAADKAKEAKRKSKDGKSKG